MKKFLVILIAVFALATPSFADNMYTDMPGGGGTAESGGNIMQVAFGVPWGGQVADAAGNVLRLSILGGGAAIVPPDTEDNGLIQNTIIERVADTAGSDIRIKFKAGYPSVTSANIFRRAGAAYEFAKPSAENSNEWALVAQNVSVNTNTDSEWKESQGSISGIEKIKVADGKNAYYRVVPSNVTDPNTIFGNSNGIEYNARTAGKVDISLKKGFNLVSIPLGQQTSNSIASTIGSQLTAVDATKPTDNIYNYYFRDGNLNSDKAALVLTAGNPVWRFTNNFDLLPYKGYWVEIVNSEKTVTVVGRVPVSSMLAEGLPIYENYNIIGNPIPVTKEIADAGFTHAKSGTATDPGDEIYNYSFDADGKLKTKKASLIQNNWQFTEPFKFNISNGFWYKRKIGAGSYSSPWVINP